MRSLLLVIKHEITSTIGKRSFWFTTFVFPLLILAFAVGPQLLARDAISREVTAGVGEGSRAGQVLGYVDGAGIVTGLPAALPTGLLRPYPDTAAAAAAVAAGEIGGYYVIHADYLSTGKVTYLAPDVAVMSGGGIESLIDYVLRFNLAGDETLAGLLNDPTPSVVLQPVAPQPAATTPANGPQGGGPSLGLPFVVMFVLFFVITMSAGYMLQSVVHEKENRTAEVLLLSIRPRALMLGKVVGLGAVALAQMAIWIAAGLLASRQRSAGLLVGEFSLTPALVAWIVLFFLGGYLVYSSAFGAIGALAPNLREGSQFTFVALLPLLVPVWLNTAFMTAPHAALATALSLFPLTAPTAMVTRLAAGGVPAWQPFVALAGLAVTAYLFVVLSARFFRADTLLSSASLSWARFAGELRRKQPAA